jgi:NADP-dependent 3-hydroxy acid dehydrogenase YdfG
MRSQQMNAQLEGNVALITGASRGIGRAVALRFAQAGATTVLAARTIADLHAVAALIQQSASETLVMPTDVTNDQQLEALVQVTLERFGHIDVLVNNAGGGTPRTPVVKALLRDWEWTLRVNLWAAMYLSRLVLPTMIERRKGTIVNISSLAGFSGKAGESAYAAAKFGVRGFSQSLFEEVREYGIKVCTVCPGYVDTTLIPPNRRIDRHKMISPDDVAEAVYSVAVASLRVCPTEIILQPQHDPLRT